ncbi:dead-box ATP-dependent RNA helicase, partial [Chrysochromulina tobinii]
MSSKEMPSSDKEKLTKEEKAAKKARKEAKAAKLAAASAAPRQSPRLQAMAAAEAIPGSKALSADAFREEHAISGSSELPDPVQHIDDAPFDARLRSALRAAKFTAPSPIQAQAWPVALAGKDVIAIAKTGSGKTLGFLFPAFSAILPKLPLGQGVGPLALVMAPVRELAQQIQVEAERFGAAVGIKSLVVYGGAPKGPQIGALGRGRPALVVGTPGRLNDLLALANPPVTNLNACGYVVLDEADRMLDMGFAPQIDKIFQLLPSKRQTLFFTATWPREVQQLAKSYLSPNAMQIFVGGADTKLVANKSVTQKFEQLTPAEKPERLMKVIMEQPADAKIVVFCNTKADCAKLEADQKRLGRGTCAIHGDKDQWERERALQAFSSGKAPIMFATDVAARGLDVRGVTLVINYDLPQGDDGVENYVHRIGRTGRAGATGIAITFWNDRVDKRQGAKLAALLADAGQE